jgi:colicin import membrane protein
MAESIIAELHGRLLRGIAAETSVHFQGLRAAAGHLRRAGLLDSRLVKKLAAVDCAYAISRHITAVSAEQCVDEVLAAIRCSNKERSGLEQVANEKTEKDKADEETADEMERVANEKIAKVKAAEEEVAAKEKIDLEQAAVKAAEEVAAAKVKAHSEQVAKEVAAAEEKAAEVKAAEEKAAAEEMTDTMYTMTEDEMAHIANFRAVRAKEAADKQAARLRATVGAAVAKVKAAAKEKTRLEQVEKESFNSEEKAAKRVKAGKFDKVDMELEALAERTPSRSSAWWDEASWRRSGWR